MGPASELEGSAVPLFFHARADAWGHRAVLRPSQPLSVGEPSPRPVDRPGYSRIFSHQQPAFNWLLDGHPYRPPPTGASGCPEDRASYLLLFEAAIQVPSARGRCACGLASCRFCIRIHTCTGRATAPGGVVVGAACVCLLAPGPVACGSLRCGAGWTSVATRRLNDCRALGAWHAARASPPSAECGRAA
jgi:hypothetical protein